MKIKDYSIIAITVLAIVGIGTILIDENTTGNGEYTTYFQSESLLENYDSLTLVDIIDEYECHGAITSIKVPTRLSDPDSVHIVLRGYSNITGVQVFRWSKKDPEELILVDHKLIPLRYPPVPTSDPTTYQLSLRKNAKEIIVKGRLYNYTGWDGEEYKVLRLDHISPYYVAKEPRELDEAQAILEMNSKYYHKEDLAEITIRNLSEDWLNTGRSIELFQELNGSWVETQGYPNNYIVTAEQIGFFPGSSWSHDLPLRHLETGHYRLVKEVWHEEGRRIKVETFFNVVERVEYYTNSTHMFRLKEINCTLPNVPEILQTARTVNIPINLEDAREIVENVFGFMEPYTMEGTVNPSFRKDDERVSFSSRYDVMYRTDVGSFNEWNRTQVVEVAEEFLSTLEQYWVDPTPLEYEITRVAPSHISSSSAITRTIREVRVRYELTLDDVPLHGPGADFGIDLCRNEVSGCEIRRPAIETEEYTPVTVSPEEAIQKMLRGESATRELGFVILQFMPPGSELTINDVSLVYYTDLPQYREWLIPVYVIKGVSHVDPVQNEEDTSEFSWYILATEYQPPV